MITNFLIKLIYDYNFVVGMSFNLLFVKLVVAKSTAFPVGHHIL